MTEEERFDELKKLTGKDLRKKIVTEKEKLVDYLDWALQHRAIDRVIEAIELFEKEFPGYSFGISGGYIHSKSRYKDVEVGIKYADFKDNSEEIAISIVAQDERFGARIKELLDKSTKEEWG